VEPRIERVAELAMKVGGRHLAPFGSYKSRHDFTQRQLMTCLILKSYLKISYRGLVELLQGHGKLREILGLEVKLPHYTALQKFSKRSDVTAIAGTIIAEIGQAALLAQKDQGVVAIDSTGLEPTTASAHYVSRSGMGRKSYVKLSLSIVCGGLFPLAAVLDIGPNNDKCQVGELLEKSFHAAGQYLPSKLLADAGYDAEWVHQVCREKWKVESWIKPVVHRKDGSLGGIHRSGMTREALDQAGYGKRWHIESFIGGMKRLCGSALTARLDITQRHETLFRLLAYTLYR
jgi:hypothetical protein